MGNTALAAAATLPWSGDPNFMQRIDEALVKKSIVGWGCGVKDPVVDVSVQWIMERIKHPVCTIGWVVRLCHGRLSPGKAS